MAKRFRQLLGPFAVLALFSANVSFAVDLPCDPKPVMAEEMANLAKKSPKRLSEKKQSFAHWMSSREPHSRVRAIQEFFTPYLIEDQGAQAAVAGLLRDGDPEVRLEARAALEKIKGLDDVLNNSAEFSLGALVKKPASRDGVSVLKKKIHGIEIAPVVDPANAVAKVSKGELALEQSEETKSFLAKLGDETPEVRQKAIREYSGTDSAARDAILDLVLKEPNTDVQGEAWSWILEHGIDSRQVMSLVASLRNSNVDRKLISDILSEAPLRMGARQKLELLVQPLLLQLVKASGEERAAISNILEHRGLIGPGKTDVVAAALAARPEIPGSQAAQLTALKALAGPEDRQLVAKYSLLRIASDDPDAAVRKKALALITEKTVKDSRDGAFYHAILADLVTRQNSLSKPSASVYEEILRLLKPSREDLELALGEFAGLKEPWRARAGLNEALVKEVQLQKSSEHLVLGPLIGREKTMEYIGHSVPETKIIGIEHAYETKLIARDDEVRFHVLQAATSRNTEIRSAALTALAKSAAEEPGLLEEVVPLLLENLNYRDPAARNAAFEGLQGILSVNKNKALQQQVRFHMDVENVLRGHYQPGKACAAAMGAGLAGAILLFKSFLNADVPEEVMQPLLTAAAGSFLGGSFTCKYLGKKKKLKRAYEALVNDLPPKERVGLMKKIIANETYWDGTNKMYTRTFLGEKVFARLKELEASTIGTLTHMDPDIRVSGVRTAAAIGRTTGKDEPVLEKALLQLLSDRHPEVQDAAAELLGELFAGLGSTDKMSSAALIGLRRAYSKDPRPVFAEAMEAIVRVPVGPKK
jgi:hypothetical protein